MAQRRDRASTHARPTRPFNWQTKSQRKQSSVLDVLIRLVDLYVRSLRNITAIAQRCHVKVHNRDGDIGKRHFVRSESPRASRSLGPATGPTLSPSLLKQITRYRALCASSCTIVVPQIEEAEPRDVDSPREGAPSPAVSRHWVAGSELAIGRVRGPMAGHCLRQFRWWLPIAILSGCCLSALRMASADRRIACTSVRPSASATAEETRSERASSGPDVVIFLGEGCHREINVTEIQDRLLEGPAAADELTISVLPRSRESISGSPGFRGATSGFERLFDDRCFQTGLNAGSFARNGLGDGIASYVCTFVTLFPF